MAPRSCDARRPIPWQCALLATLLMGVPGIPSGTADAATAAQSTAAARPGSTAATTRFSELTELTPANVQGLMPLVARRLTVALHDRDDSSAAVHLRLQRFADERTGQVQVTATDSAPLRPIGGRVGSVVSYLVGSPDVTGHGDSAAPAPALRAWDPIERRVLWSVTESLPISSRTLVTAGGLVFYVTADGWIKALDARTGRLLWKHKVDDKLQEPLSFRGIDGHQCIAVRSVPRASGLGSAPLLLFALPH